MPQLRRGILLHRWRDSYDSMQRGKVLKFVKQFVRRVPNRILFQHYRFLFLHSMRQWLLRFSHCKHGLYVVPERPVPIISRPNVVCKLFRRPVYILCRERRLQ